MAAIRSDVARRCGKSTSTAEKLEITRLVEESHLSARRKLAKLGILRTTFYRRYDRYLQRGEAGLADQSPQPKHVWNRVPDEVRRKVIRLALDETELSPRELSVMFKNYEQHFVSEFAVYRTLKAHDLFTSPALTVLKAANELLKTRQLGSISSSSHACLHGQPGKGVKGVNRRPLHQDSGMELVLSQHGARRLQPQYRFLETLYRYAGRGRERNTGPRIEGLGV